MATKVEELRKLEEGEGCLGRALPDEPIFILRAHDGSAPELVRKWAQIRAEQIIEGRKPWEDIADCREAYALAADMEAWRQSEIAAVEAMKPRLVAARPEFGTIRDLVLPILREEFENAGLGRLPLRFELLSDGWSGPLVQGEYADFGFRLIPPPQDFNGRTINEVLLDKMGPLRRWLRSLHEHLE